MLNVHTIESAAQRLTLPPDTPGMTEAQIAEHNAAVHDNTVALQRAFCRGDVSFAEARELTADGIRTLKDERRVAQLAALKTRAEIGGNIPQCAEGHEAAQAELVRFVSHLLNH